MYMAKSCMLYMYDTIIFKCNEMYMYAKHGLVVCITNCMRFLKVMSLRRLLMVYLSASCTYMRDLQCLAFHCD